LLFVHVEPLPEGMQPSELQNFAEVTMEGLSPMPLEQLAWGYLAHERFLHVLLFAASRERLNQENLPPEESFFHVLPSFFAAAPAESAAAHWVLLWEGGQITGLHYDSESRVPSRIELEPVAEDTPAGAFVARDRLLKRLGATARNETTPGLLAQPQAVRGSGERLLFSFLHYTAAEAEPTRLEGHAPADPASRWTADLRDNVFRSTEQNRRRTLRLMNRALQAAGAVALVLFVLQLVWAGGAIWYRSTAKHVEGQKEAVATVEQNQALLNKIDQFSSHQLRPFEMLGAINELRPPSILFKNTKANNSNQLTAQCTAPDPSVMNSFFDAIAKSGLVDIVGNPNTALGRGGVVTFNLDVKFRQPLAPEPMPADKPPADATPPPPATVAQTTPNLPIRQTFNFGAGDAGAAAEGEAGPNGQPAPEAPPANDAPKVYLNN
jgi:hypothetical protein